MVLSRSRASQSNVISHSVPLIRTCMSQPRLHVVRVMSAIGIMSPVSGRAIMLVMMNCVGNVPKYK